MVKKDDWLVSALVLNGKGSAQKLSADELSRWKPEQGFLWVHLNLSHQGAAAWLKSSAKLDAWTLQTLTDSDDSRPRTLIHKDALLLVLRTVNLNDKAEPDDMVFLKLWATKNRLITLRLHPAINFEDIRNDFKNHEGPIDANTLIELILETTLDSIAATISDLQEKLDDMEELIIAKNEANSTYDDLSEMMRQLVIIHRFLAPEREALGVLTRRETSWFNDVMDRACKENLHRMERIMEDIELLRERIRINQDALNAYDVKRAQRNMYMLSVIATIFLPLSFLTGLFGMNVGGIPFSSDPHGLLITFILIAVSGVILLYIFRKLKWI